ncbi:efflux transporter periplasmic adaptor subunit, partial [Komagataeibacter melaceti]
MKRITLALLLLGAGCLPARAEEGALPPIVKLDAAAVANEGVSVVTATPGTVAPVLPIVSRVMPDTTRVVHIHPAGSGKVLAVPVQPGMHVARGQA